MKRVVFLVAAFILVLAAMPASACQSCNQYYNYESQSWCLYCDDGTNCGWFNCWIFQPISGSNDYCTGDDAGCFTTGRHCAHEPQVEMPQHLNEAWRLGRVHVYRAPENGARPADMTVPSVATRG